jgi:hypothetical protein
MHTTPSTDMHDGSSKELLATCGDMENKGIELVGYWMGLIGGH